MKKLLSIFASIALTGLVSCKKEVTAKPVPVKESTKETVKTVLQSNTATYDYQKAIMAKRTINVNPNGLN
jgi:hypothetical protein